MASETESTRQYHVLPVRDLVLFPGIITPLFVGRPRSLKAIELAMLQDKTVVIVAQKDMQTEDPEPEDLFEVGTLCNILQMIRIPDGTTKVLIEGIDKVRILRFTKGTEVLEADVVPVKWEKNFSEKSEALKRSVLEQFEKYVTLHPKIPSEVLVSAVNIEDPGQLADLVASHLTIKVREKQKLLEIDDPDMLMKHLLKVLIGEVDILELEHDIQDKVRQELERGHKEYYLREQLKIIQDELGQDESSSELDDFKKKIDDAGMPEEVHAKAMHELGRLSKMPSMSAEATVARTYIDWMVSLPWSVESEDRLNLSMARQVLDEDHYGLDKVKERILEYLAVRICTKGNIKGQVLCFVGPPGVGKTSLAKSIARALDRRFVNMSLGGLRDEAEIRGHRKTYVGSLPGRIIQKIRQAGTSNPVMLMDEIDKMGMDFRGDPSAALLEVLDPEQNDSFADHFLEVPFDLSKVMFITTANVTHSIPRPLLDRMEVIDIPGYVAEEKVYIAKKHLLPKIMKEHGLTSGDLRISQSALECVIKDYTREAGVRNLERELAKICRKVTRKIVESDEGKSEKLKVPISVKKNNLKDYLGSPKIYDVNIPKYDRQGAAIGLAWTQAGGDVLVIEAATMKGKGRVTFTGNLGDIMQESAQTAYGFIKANSDKFGLEDINWDSIDIHLHVPEGAIPKDGPSAGITIAIAMLSAVSGRKISSSVAMTGEITLLGQVLPVGGIREKVLAAKRNGIFRVILPTPNKTDLGELELWSIDGMKFDFVGNASEVFQLALES